MAGTNGVDTQTKLAELKSKAERAKTEHARAEAQLESIERQRHELHKELEGFGVTEDGLDQAIADLDKQIEAGLAEAEKLLVGEGEPIDG